MDETKAPTKEEVEQDAAGVRQAVHRHFPPAGVDRRRAHDELARLESAALLGAQVPGLVADNAALVRALADLSDIGGLTADLRAVFIAKLRAEPHPGAALLAEHEAKVSSLQARVEELTAENETNNHAATVYESDIKSLQARVAYLEGLADEEKSAAEHHQRQCERLGSERDALRAQVAAVKAEGERAHAERVYLAPATVLKHVGVDLFPVNAPEPEAPLLCERCSDIRGGMHVRCGSPGCECFCGRIRMATAAEAVTLSAPPAETASPVEGPDTECAHCGKRRAEHLRRHHGAGPKGTVWYCRAPTEQPFKPTETTPAPERRCACGGQVTTWYDGCDYCEACATERK